MFKRPRDIFDSPASSSPPFKRARSSLPPSSPLKESSPLKGSSSPFYSRTPYQQPSDSPTNPLGLNRIIAPQGSSHRSLPCATSFSKHLTLRCQLVLSESLKAGNAPHAKGKGKARARDKPQDAGEGVYRVVQVPPNYTFRHLHQLILYLFASDARLSALVSSSRSRRRSSRLTEKPFLRAQATAQQPARGTKRKAEELDTDEEDVDGPSGSQDVFTSATPGHVFDVLDCVRTYHSAYRPGVVKPGTGATRVRLSSVRDRSLFPDVFERQQDRALMEHARATPAEAEEDVFGPTKCTTPIAEEDEEDLREWAWERETDLMVGDVWAAGLDPQTAIIYHHTRTTAIHITLDPKPPRPQKGSSNNPSILRARGTASPSALRIADLLPRDSILTGEGTDDTVLSDAGRLRIWNTPGVFLRFLVREAGASAPAPPEPDLYVVEASPMPASSPARPLPLTHAHTFSSPPSSERRARASSVMSARSARWELELGFDALPEDTPQPKRAAQQRRMARTSMRLERLNESGLGELSDDDTDKEEDELAGDDGEGETEKKAEAEPARTKAASVKKPKLEDEEDDNEEEVDQLRDDDWDPFGDGEELDW